MSRRFSLLADVSKMTLSTSRQEFLACETQAAENIQYGRKGGIFISHCVCVGFVLFAILLAVIVGVIAHFITYFKQTKNVEFWDDTEPFGQSSRQAADLRLPTDVVPSFYRLKLKTDLENSTFTGEVSITLRASKQVKQIILHSKNLSISNDAKLSEQIYERVAILRTKRGAENDTTDAVTTNPNESSNTTETVVQNGTETSTTAPTIPVKPVDTQVTHSDTKTVKILDIMGSTGDRLVITLASNLKSGVDYILQLSFSGKIEDLLNGFYKSTYVNKDKETRTLAVTQFEPTSARAAFPCFDEPGFKAKFEISIAHSQNYTALSNMKVSTTELIPDQPNYQWTHFERSVRMSTYLVAYIVSDFQSVETSYLSKDNVTKSVKIWARPEFIGKANYALNITPKILDYYEDVFGVPYVLDKLDLVAIPDFSAGAMENWGLITFKETALLFDEKDGVPSDKQNIAIDIAHELAHQWFGNLVTMRWWTDLWLNEGFATYVQYLGVNHVEPEWNIFESLSQDKFNLLRIDARKNTYPVSREVMDANEIEQKFDDLSYMKGATLIRMLNHTISEELFLKGLMIYLNDWKFSNAEESDLWAAMAKATVADPLLADLSIVEFMNSWTRQAGYPVLNVNRNYETGAIELEQRLFSVSQQTYQAMVDQLWYIPVSYTSLDAPVGNWSTKPKTWLKNRISAVQSDLNATQPLYVNVGAIGYYRVNYDQKNWQLLSSALLSGAVQSPITRAQLIEDAFNLAKASSLDYTYALGLTTYIRNGEDSKIVWNQVLGNMAFLKFKIKDVPGYEHFLEYMQLILKKQLEKLNYGLDKPKDDNEAFLIEVLLMWECIVESPRCLAWTKSQFESWTSQEDPMTNNPIPSYLRSVVYMTAVRHGGRQEFNFLWNIFKNSTDPNVQNLVISVLPSTKDESLISSLLEKSLSEIPMRYALGAWGVGSRAGKQIAQQFLLDNFDRIYSRFGELDWTTFKGVIQAAFSSITTQYELDRLKSFALKNKEKLLPMSQSLQMLVDGATNNISWKKKHGRDITQWFEDYVTGKLSEDGSTRLTPEVTAAPEVTSVANESVVNTTTVNNSSVTSPTK